MIKRFYGSGRSSEVQTLNDICAYQNPKSVIPRIVGRLETEGGYRVPNCLIELSSFAADAPLAADVLPGKPFIDLAPTSEKTPPKQKKRGRGTLKRIT